MAPNRKPYYDDEVLEGRRLERVQVLGVLLLLTVVIGLPLYWIFEPSRQAGAVSGEQERFRFWGEELFETTANGGFNCAGCHGGMQGGGNVAPYAITDANTQEVTAVNWYAPALNTVFYRFSQEEVRFILNYGRPFSPMSAWGAPGGGPMTAQNIETLLVYLKSIQIQPEGCLTDDSFVDKADPYVCEGGVLPQADQAVHPGQCRRRTWLRTPVRPRVKRCSTRTSAAAPTAVRGATPRAGATASLASRRRARSVGTSPVVPPTRTSPATRT